jgi:FtsH-binding integral membrane protein
MIFIISGLIGTVLTTKFTLSLGKILVVTTIAFLLVYFIAIMLTMFIPGAATNNFYYLIYAIFGLLMIGYIMYDFSIIKKMDGFVAAQHSEIQKKLVFMFGFKLLIDFVGLV